MVGDTGGENRVATVYPLHEAAYNGDLVQVRQLLRRGADPTERDEDGATPLMEALQEGHTEICQLLLEAGADTRDVARSGPRGEALLKFLVSFGCPVNELLDPSWLSVAEARTLLELGADPNRPNVDYGETPLYRACKKSAKMVHLLLRNGADPLQHNADGSHPLHFCASWNYAARAKLLLDAGVPVDYTECEGYTALALACSQCHYKTVQLLLERGANPNLSNCLERAARHGSAEVVSLLLAHGARKTEQAREAAKEWLPDLLSKATAYMSQWGSTRYRWGKNCVGERTLTIETGNFGANWTDGHARILELLA